MVPTTETVPAGSLEVGGVYETVDPNPGRARFLPELTATYGFGRGEIGAGYLKEDFSASGLDFERRYLSIHAKYRFLELKNSGAAFSVGVQQLDFSRGGDVTTVSLAGSLPVRIAPLRQAGNAAQNAPEMARLHFGLFHHRVQDSDSETRPFIGIEAPLVFGSGRSDSPPNLSLAADYAPRAGNVNSLASLAVRYKSSAGLGAQVGVGAIGGDRKFFAGLTYRFGFGS